ncbi:GNAT family N-acetyltransferase [Haematospirillum sp. H1815]|uniref:GNAT family N-acetyltransferase n=1 Tax=Haematospirillum sp. H1815 TaxID=2723108 RepID=UPI00143AA340|nr:GNAT family N-acetyltransferase [Haematospirillum sp. H1815]NKD76181.1 GNAT family N-acetyltransferase [Haematospirillum sp. H1815]
MAGSDGTVIREATLIDADALGLIHRIGLQAAVPWGMPPTALVLSAGDRAAEWREWLKARATTRNGGQAMVADSMHGPVGFICVAPGHPPGVPEHWLISHFTVLGAHQKQGLGRQLLKAALEKVARGRGVRADLFVPSGAPWAAVVEHMGGLPGGAEPLVRAGMSFMAERYSFSVLSA